MSDVYKIAVNLAMTSNAPSFLAALTSQLHLAHVKVKDLEGGLSRLSRIKLAVGGGIAIAGGTAMLEFLKQGIDSTKELSHELTQLQKLNIGATRLAQVRSAAVATTKSVAGVNEVDALKMYGSAYSIFGHEGALKLIKPLSEFAQVAGNTSGNYEKAADSIYSMIRAGDLMGKFVDERTHQLDTDKLQHFLDLGSKVILGTHGKVDSNAWLQLAQQGGPALSGMTDKGLMTMAIAAQAMGGPRAGTALTSLYQQMIGGKMTKPVAEKLNELGLVGDFDVGKGGHLTWHKGALDNNFTRSLKSDPIEAVEIMRKAMEAHGVNGIEKQVPMLFEILGRQTTQRLVHDLLRNMPQILGERERIMGSQGIGSAKVTQDSQDIVQAEHNLEEAWKNLKYAFFGPDSGAYISILNLLTTNINRLTDAIRATSPETLVNIAKGLAILGVALIGAGAVALLAAIGPVGWLVLGIGALGAAFATFAPKQFAEWLDGFTTLMHGLVTFNWREIVSGIGKEFAAAFHLLPDQVQSSINAAITAIGDFIKKAFDKIAALLGSYQFKPAVPTNPGDNIGALPQAYRGGGFGGGGLIQAAFSGAANDNGGGKILAGTIAGGISNSNVIIMNGGGMGGGGFGGSGGGSWNGRALAVGAGTGIGHVASQADRAAFIRRYAASIGIDPTTALRVAQSEGFYNFTGDHGTSFGDFQMHIGGGLGDRLRKAGINPADPHNWMQSDKMALDIARREGWGAWHGAARAGIGSRQGIGVSPRGPIAVGPPPRPQRDQHHHFRFELDGKQLEAKVTHMQAERGQFATAVGGVDSHGSFAGPGTYLNDAA